MDTRLHLRIILMALALFFALGAGETGDTGSDGSDSSGGCGGDPPPLIQDPSFDLWCGDALCAWEVEEGEIAQVATWHAGDHGVGMLSDPTILSQRATATHEDTHCIWFTLMVDSDPGVTVQLEIDFRDDGLTEYAHPIASTDWTTYSYFIRPPEWFDTLRFRIRKTGTGHATLAQIMADRADASLCESQQPLAYRDLPLGAFCEAGAECGSEICSEHPVLSSDPRLQGSARTSCGECTQDGCEEGNVCGLAFTEGNLPYAACVQPSAKLLGEACSIAEECGTGVCCEGRCSECCSDGHTCTEGEDCQQVHGNGDADTRMMPWMCDPGERDRITGQACIQPADCASATCGGQDELKLCDPSGQPCERDADCPAFDGEPARCVTLGPKGGACLPEVWPGESL